MARRRLTAAGIRKIKPPLKGQVDHFDAGYPGLALRVSYGGSRSWVFFYRRQGKQRRLTLGSWPALELAQAREAWREAGKRLASGLEPIARPRVAVADDFASVAQEWLKRDQAGNRSHDEVNVQFPRGGAIVAGLAGDADLGFVSPSYTFATPVLGGALATVAIVGAYGNMQSSVQATLTGPKGGVLSLGRSDTLTGFGDVPVLGKLNWNAGVYNYMLYALLNIPNGSYEKRLSNLSIGHWGLDTGIGYTYLNPKTGWEFTAVLGATYNGENHTLDYQNGTDLHLDLAASKFLTKQLHVGVVGYAYQQITGDSGPGARLGDFQSRVFGIGPQIGYTFPLERGYQGYVNVKAYQEFGAENRAEGWNAWVTFVISPTPPTTPK